jgi:hypothetical protein
MEMLWVVRNEVSLRKSALFTAACCRRVWPWLPGECRRQVEAVERLAEDPVRSRAVSTRCLPEGPTVVDFTRSVAAFQSAAAASPRSVRGRLYAATEAMQYLSWAYRARDGFVLGSPALEAGPRRRAEWRAERKAQADLVREVLGPWSSTPLSSWLTANGGAAVRIADRIDAEQAFELMPTLAGALEEAECITELPVAGVVPIQDDTERRVRNILYHCRFVRSHTKGCWLIDAILGKS